MTFAISLHLDSARHGDAPVLGAIALEVSTHETVVIAGPSGVGKTTLLRVLAGLHSDWQGRLDIPGRVAMVFQEPTLLPWASALDNLCIVTGCTSSQGREALASVDLADKAGALPGALSLGQQRRLALARAFVPEPQVLLMDEAFVSLDPELLDEMMGVFEALRDRHPVATVMVTHAVDEATRLGTRLLRLQGSPAQLVDMQV